MVTSWRPAVLGSQHHARARGTGVLWGPSKTYRCKEEATGQELWLLVKEPTYHHQTEASQAERKQESTHTLLSTPAFQPPAQKSREPSCCRFLGHREVYRKFESRPAGVNGEYPHALSENIFLSKKEETLHVLLTSKEAVRIGQEAQAPGEGDCATYEGPFSSQSLGFSANKITRKKD